MRKKQSELVPRVSKMVDLHFFITGKGLEISFNGGNIPSIKLMQKMLAEINQYIKLGQKKIDLINAEWLIESKREHEAHIAALRAQTKEPRVGYIYILKSRDLYKIGRTKNPEHRLKTYRTENPHGIRKILLQQVNDPEKAELALLKHFIAKKVKGEWFLLCQKDITEAKKIICNL